MKKFDKNNIKFFMDQEQHTLFFDPLLQELSLKLATALNKNSTIWIYPDAMVKPNGLPNGIACFSNKANALLLPFILRDPGCGYLTFKLEFYEKIESGWYQAAGELLEDLVNAKTSLSKLQHHFPMLDLDRILIEGLGVFNLSAQEYRNFFDKSFNVDTKQVVLSKTEREQLLDDFMTVTNTVELRTLLNIQDSELLEKCNIQQDTLIGFIHSGCLLFPGILAQKFIYRIAEYAENNSLFSLDQIKQGIFGVPINSMLGSEYSQWLYAAMNYALVSRYCVFKLIKKVIENTFPCKLTLINDNMHAGLFEKKINNEKIIYSVRGVQNIFKTTALSPNRALTLLAGQRETVAALVTGGERISDYLNWVCHGTGYRIVEGYDYAGYFTHAEIEQYLRLAQTTFYNSLPCHEACLPYTYNLNASLDYFNKIGLAKTVAHLAPLVNIQSNWLKKSGN